jgi:hypothetical protein
MDKKKLKIFLISICFIFLNIEVVFCDAPGEEIYISTQTSETWRYSIGFYELYGKEVELTIYEKPDLKSKKILYCNYIDTETLKPISSFGYWDDPPSERINKFPLLKIQSSWYYIIYDIVNDRKGWIYNPKYGRITLFENITDCDMIFIEPLLYDCTSTIYIYDKPNGKIKEKKTIPNENFLKAVLRGEVSIPAKI